jgi:hypothetical protein
MKVNQQNRFRDLEQSGMEKRAFNGKKEVATLEELKALIHQHRKHSCTQAILITKRVLMKHKVYPNVFVLETCYNSLLKGWQGKFLTHDNVFAKVLFLIDFFNVQAFSEEESTVGNVGRDHSFVLIDIQLE